MAVTLLGDFFSELKTGTLTFDIISWVSLSIWYIGFLVCVAHQGKQGLVDKWYLSYWRAA